MKKVALILITILTPFLLNAQDILKQKTLSISEMQEDFRFYRKALEETHPGLYRYTAKEQMDDKLDSIQNLLNQPLAFYDFHKILLGLNADIRCAHSAVYPTKLLDRYMVNSIKTLPFYCYPIGNKQYIIFNGTDNKKIKPFYELTHINGLPVNSIFQVIKRYAWSDGYIETSKKSLLEGPFFSLFYHLTIAQPDSFDLQLKDLEGNSLSVNVPAQVFSLTQKKFSQNEVNHKVLKMYGKPRHKEVWYTEFYKDMKHTALIGFSQFSHSKAGSDKEAQALFRKFMDNAMAKMEKKGIESLIIDVRENAGGYDILGAELLSYLMKDKKQFPYYRRLYSITNNSSFLSYSDLPKSQLKNLNEVLKPEDDGFFTLIDEESKAMNMFQAKPNCFKGKIYILMSGKTSSGGAEFTALAKEHGIGLFVGEESGSVYEGGNSGSFLNFNLPNSKIRVRTPLVYYENAVNTPESMGRGTIPDFQIDSEINDLLIRNDTVLEFVKKLIRNGE